MEVSIGCFMLMVVEFTLPNVKVQSSPEQETPSRRVIGNCTLGRLSLNLDNDFVAADSSDMFSLK